MGTRHIHVTGTFLGLLALSAAGGALGSAGCGSDRPPGGSSSPSDGASPTSSLTPAPDAQTRALTANFDVDVRVEPAHAQLVLDGEEVGRGHVARQLPRDGRTHELRITAEGYLPERLVFADASPPGEVSLKATRRAPAAEPPATPPPPPPPRRAHAFRAPAPRSRAESPPPPAPVEEVSPSIPVTRPTPAPPPAQPNIKIIEPEAPHVRVIE